MSSSASIGCFPTLSQQARGCEWAGGARTRDQRITRTTGTYRSDWRSYSTAGQRVWSKPPRDNKETSRISGENRTTPVDSPSAVNSGDLSGRLEPCYVRRPRPEKAMLWLIWLAQRCAQDHACRLLKCAAWFELRPPLREAPDSSRHARILLFGHVKYSICTQPRLA